MKFLFVSLAANQSEFFGKIGEFLENNGSRVAHLSFHSGAAERLRKTGAEVFDPFESDYPDDDNIFDIYGINNPDQFLLHEKYCYEIYDREILLTKFKKTLARVDTIISRLLRESEYFCVVQELGGFISVISVFLACQHHGINNYFIEPSIFKGRICLTKNSFGAPRLTNENELASREELDLYLERVAAEKVIVIPQKDTRHYRSPVLKLIDLKNFKRLIEKIFFKYCGRGREEFGHIYLHVRRHVKMAISNYRLRNFYSERIPTGSYIYFPFHVPADFALTFRAPQFLNQVALIEYLSDICPSGYRLVIKEHPAMIGAFECSEIRALLKRCSNLHLLSPEILNHDVLMNASCVVTVNSKSGFEAMLNRIPVVCLGDAVYKHSAAVRFFDSLDELRTAFTEMKSFLSEFQIDDIEEFCFKAWQSSYEGELYVGSEANVRVFSRSLSHAIDTSGV